jgi:hypothetical protein
MLDTADDHLDLGNKATRAYLCHRI